MLYKRTSLLLLRAEPDACSCITEYKLMVRKYFLFLFFTSYYTTPHHSTLKAPIISTHTRSTWISSVLVCLMDIFFRESHMLYKTTQKKKKNNKTIDEKFSVQSVILSHTFKSPHLKAHVLLIVHVHLFCLCIQNNRSIYIIIKKKNSLLLW